MRTCALSIVFLGVLVGCNPGGGASCGAGRSGITDCFTAGGSTCQAGQYCDMSSGFNACVAGCTSDANCGAGDLCARASGEAVGVCRSCTSMGTPDGGVGPGGLVARCDAAVTNINVCMLLTPAQVAAARAACVSGLSDEQRRAIADCVDAALGDCNRMRSCVPGAAVCGNGTCEAGETMAGCPSDCHSSVVCGNGTCDAGESTSNCAADCPAPSMCGNGTCDGAETMTTCPADCTDSTRADCRQACMSYDFFMCLDPGGLDSCYASCTAATMGQRQQFITCANGGGTVACDTSCLRYLP